MNTRALRLSLGALAGIAWLLAAVPPARAADPLHMTFVNENTTYASPGDAWIVFSYTGHANDEFDGSVRGTGPKSGAIAFSAGAGPSAGSYFSEVFRITDLAEGIDVTRAPSTRIYVSLGQPLDAKANPTTPGAPFSFFGIPSGTAGDADPNWNVRWDFFETTLSDPRRASDYGDLSVINQFAIPLRVELYASATEQTPANLLQSAETAANPAALRQALAALAHANLANNDFATVPGNWRIETPATPGPTNPHPGTFLRQIGPASGGTDPEWIGPFPSMNPYAEFVANVGGTPIATSLQGTTSVAATLQQTYDMTTTAAFSAPTQVSGIEVSGTIETSTWNPGTPENPGTATWNPPAGDGKTYTMRIALDEDVGLTTGRYHLSNALYGSAWQGNAGVSYWIDDGGGAAEVTQAAFLDSISSNGTMALQTVNEWMQNLFVGYCFGLVGNTQTVSHLPAGHPLVGVSLSDMGSAGWAELRTLIGTGELATSDVPFFTLTDAMQRPLYNQWAKIVFDHSQTAYGMQYSDMFQPLLALYTYQTNYVNDVYQETAQDVLSWKVTILADTVPEPGPLGALAALGALLALRSLPSRRACFLSG